jgi:RNA polymerase, sigma-24 subunit, ECF subfamily
MPYEEIARALDMTVPATKSLLFRARNMLKEALASFLS